MWRKLTISNVEMKRRALWKSTIGSEKKPAYVIHRKLVTLSMMQAWNDTCRNCKETLISTVEASVRVFLECNHRKVQAVSRISTWLALKAMCIEALED